MLHTIPIGSDDEEFLFQVYASTRADEMRAFGFDPAMQESFLNMQWMAQQHSYAMQYPGADHQIIRLGEQRIGRLMVMRTDEQLVMVDLSLLPEFRRQGIGSELLRRLQAEAAAAERPLRLSVLRTNPARRLYERFGFVTTAENELYESMEWRGNA